MRAPIDYRPDCTRCAALCCVALPFDEGEDFAFSKPGGVPCKRLRGHMCTIHGHLESAGFPGCARYDCLGAGQAVTQDLFAGASWRDDPELLEPMMAAFAGMRKAMELAQLLEAAAALPLPPEQEEERQDLLETVMPADGWTPEAIAGFELGPVPREVHDFLRGLRFLL